MQQAMRLAPTTMGLDSTAIPIRQKGTCSWGPHQFGVEGSGRALAEYITHVAASISPNLNGCLHHMLHGHLTRLAKGTDDCLRVYALLNEWLAFPQQFPR